MREHHQEDAGQQQRPVGRHAAQRRHLRRVEPVAQQPAGRAGPGRAQHAGGQRAAEHQQRHPRRTPHGTSGERPGHGLAPEHDQARDDQRARPGRASSVSPASSPTQTATAAPVHSLTSGDRPDRVGEVGHGHPDQQHRDPAHSTPLQQLVGRDDHGQSVVAHPLRDRRGGDALVLGELGLAGRPSSDATEQPQRPLRDRANHLVPTHQRGVDRAGVGTVGLLGPAVRRAQQPGAGLRRVGLDRLDRRRAPPTSRDRPRPAARRPAPRPRPSRSPWRSCAGREVQAQPERGVHRLADGGEAALELVADRDPQGYDGPQPRVRLRRARRSAARAGRSGPPRCGSRPRRRSASPATVECFRSAI